MAPAEAEKGGNIQRHGRNLEAGTLQCIPVLERPELQLLLYYSVRGFPAADILMLVTAAHMGQSPLFERIKCHGRSIVETGKKITGLM